MVFSWLLVGVVEVEVVDIEMGIGIVISEYAEEEGEDC